MDRENLKEERAGRSEKSDVATVSLQSVDFFCIGKDSFEGSEHLQIEGFGVVLADIRQHSVEVLKEKGVKMKRKDEETLNLLSVMVTFWLLFGVRRSTIVSFFLNEANDDALERSEAGTAEAKENIPSITSKSSENPLGSAANCPQTLAFASFVRALGGSFDHWKYANEKEERMLTNHESLHLHVLVWDLTRFHAGWKFDRRRLREGQTAWRRRRRRSSWET